MNSTTYLDEQITDLQEELWEKQGETLAVHAWELIGLKRELTRLQLERDRLIKI